MKGGFGKQQTASKTDGQNRECSAYTSEKDARVRSHLPSLHLCGRSACQPVSKLSTTVAPASDTRLALARQLLAQLDL
jgi:hypothetical protein